MADIKMTQISTTQWGYYLNSLMRWYGRLITVYKQRGVLDYDEAEDMANAFYIFCYHFKDWLINDSTVKIAKKEVEDYVHKSVPLQLCGDICHGIKHLNLTSVKSDAKNIRVSSAINITAVAGGGKGGVSYSRIIEIDDKEYDGLELAKDCLRDWQAFLKANKLIKGTLI